MRKDLAADEKELYEKYKNDPKAAAAEEDEKKKVRRRQMVKNCQETLL
jgi:hypothetical protein